jgi:hypothetical protein
MAKKQTKTTAPNFDGARVIGGYDKYQIVADINGKLWWVDCESGSARPVTFGK